MYFDYLGYLHSARVSKCPKCGRIIDENSIAKNLIEVKICGESELKMVTINFHIKERYYD